MVAGEGVQAPKPWENSAQRPGEIHKECASLILEFKEENDYASNNENLCD